ncbi:restriction endonuclease [Microbispora sp. NEAU-D428]|uniref:restriction endonuclease n=1 Tax=Microbispora sitophila TaxID=2771537 RepID=UPI001867556E|nr:restriction endonuclease [Microbispora sitophila]MBE3012287.1 restriction endonuclease [Microbispora sitophila]
MPASDLPSYKDLLWPALLAIRDLGGSATNSEILEQVQRQLGLTEQQLEVLHKGGPRTEVAYRLAWALSYLKGMGLLENSRKGVWALTSLGQIVEKDQLEELRKGYDDKRRKTPKSPSPPALTDIIPGILEKQGASDVVFAELSGGGVESPNAEEPPEEGAWRSELLEAIIAAGPSAFERLTQRLLRETGFDNVIVTGRSGDGGIDGTADYWLSLVSLTVVFQCKCSRKSLGPDEVREFQGAMHGKADKGILITTGTFTPGAQAEARRAGALRIDLIDGARLCDLLKEFKLGVETKLVEAVEIDREWFMRL